MLPAEEAQDRAAQLTGIGAEAASVSDVLLTGQSALRNDAWVSQPDLAREQVSYYKVTFTSGLAGVCQAA